MPIFGLAMFGSSKNRRRKLMTHLKPWRNSQSNICFLFKNIDLNIWLFDLILIWVKNKLLWRPICRMTMTIDIYLWNGPQNTCHTARLWLLFSGDLCDLTLALTFSGMTLILTQYPSEIFTSTLCKFELFAACLTDPTAQSVKTVFFYLWPDIDVTRDLYL